LNKDVKRLTLKDILYSENTQDVTLPNGLTVTIRNLSVKDRIDAETEASKHPLWDKFNDLEKAREVQRMLMLKMLVDPKITREEYLSCKEEAINELIEYLSMIYAERISALTDRSRKALRDFLDRMRVE